jgi:hypothetical protein
MVLWCKGQEPEVKPLLCCALHCSCRHLPVCSIHQLHRAAHRTVPLVQLQIQHAFLSALFVVD